jgi:acetyltransferase-like isoleucine patch superfamily enzyme
MKSFIHLIRKDEAKIYRDVWWLPKMIKYAHFGKNVKVDRKAWIVGHKQIRLKDGCRIHKFCHLRADKDEGIEIGRRSEIFPYAMLMTYGGFIKIGDDCTVNPYCVLYGHGGLVIGNGVRIAAHTVMIPANHTFDDANCPIFEQPVIAKGILIEDDVWIGAGVCLLDGVKIGKGSVIGAGSVVTCNIPEVSVAVGTPARVIRQRGSKKRDEI